ncbi:MAG: hypothetical protein HY617_02835 [Candidatus Sungbacteria bacterium]|nr:hypothetical protein [Candidatus Sungbacteria bacterium]
MVDRMVGMGMPEAKDAEDAWCYLCRRYWRFRDGSMNAASDTIYYDMPRNPSETPARLVCSPCMPRVYALS